MSSQGQEEWFKVAIKENLFPLFDYDSFEKNTLVASGAFGTIYKAYSTSAKKLVALKSLHNDEATDDEFYRMFVRELKNISAVDHKNINKFMGICLDSSTGTHFLVLQYADGGNLRSYLRNHFSKLDWQKKIIMAKDISSGLSCIHDANIVHRDLHSKNILVHEERLMIADLGLSKSLYDNSGSIAGGMIAYTDPQYLKNQFYKRNKASDIYSLGVLLWELSSGKIPFNSMTGLEMAHNILNGVREKPVDGTPLDYMNIYISSWEYYPTQRPTIGHINSSLDTIEMESIYNDSNYTETIDINTVEAYSRDTISLQSFQTYSNIQDELNTSNYMKRPTISSGEGVTGINVPSASSIGIASENTSSRSRKSNSLISLITRVTRKKWSRKRANRA